MNTIHGTSAQAPTQQRLASMYVGDHLPDVLDLLDQLHSAASDGTLAHTTTLTQDDIVSLLREMIFVAEETLAELDLTAPHSPARHDNIVRLVQKR